jgi:hypothetical protein
MVDFHRKGGDSMTYERPAVLATYKVEELMTEAAVCTTYEGLEA